MSKMTPTTLFECDKCLLRIAGDSSVKFEAGSITGLDPAVLELLAEHEKETLTSLTQNGRSVLSCSSSTCIEQHDGEGMLRRVQLQDVLVSDVKLINSAEESERVPAAKRLLTLAVMHNSFIPSFVSVMKPLVAACTHQNNNGTVLQRTLIRLFTQLSTPESGKPFALSYVNLLIALSDSIPWLWEAIILPGVQQYMDIVRVEGKDMNMKTVEAQNEMVARREALLDSVETLSNISAIPQLATIALEQKGLVNTFLDVQAIHASRTSVAVNLHGELLVTRIIGFFASASFASFNQRIMMSSPPFIATVASLIYPDNLGLTSRAATIMLNLLSTTPPSNRLVMTQPIVAKDRELSASFLDGERTVDRNELIIAARQRAQLLVKNKMVTRLLETMTIAFKECLKVQALDSAAGVALPRLLEVLGRLLGHAPREGVQECVDAKGVELLVKMVTFQAGKVALVHDARVALVTTSLRLLCMMVGTLGGYVTLAFTPELITALKDFRANAEGFTQEQLEPVGMLIQAALESRQLLNDAGKTAK